jgi:NhaP-type Na+/H+ or K+/H+ antiporter
MSNELISILVLVAIFVLGTTLPLNMGVLGIVAAFVVGTAMGVSEDDIFLGFHHQRRDRGRVLADQRVRQHRQRRRGA